MTSVGQEKEKARPPAAFGAVLLFLLILALTGIISTYKFGGLTFLDDSFALPRLNFIEATAGGFASIICESVTQPLELMKVRLQVGTSSSQISALAVFLHAIREDGILSLWNGTSAAVLRQFIYQWVKMLLYEPIRSLMELQFFGGKVRNHVVWIMVVAGGVAGALGCAASQWSDYMKVRMQADLNGEYKSLMHCLHKSIRKVGFSGMYRGIIPACQRSFIVNASELATYGYFKMLVVKYHMGGKDDIVTHFYASAMAGFVATICSCPVDRAKNLLITSEKTGGLVLCFVHIYRTQGLVGFYKGFWAMWVRMAPWNMVFFICFEQIRQRLYVYFS